MSGEQFNPQEEKNSPHRENNLEMENNKPNMDKAIKTISERQYQNLKNARDKKERVRQEKKDMEESVLKSLSYIYNRLSNIEDQVSHLPRIGKRKQPDDENNETQISKKTKKDEPINLNFRGNDTIADQFIRLGIGALATVAVTVVINTIKNGWSRYNRSREQNSTMDNDPAGFGLPMV
jgi:hypothetical protein